MDIKAIAQELADLPVYSDYTFENGMRFSQKLGAKRIEALLLALLDRGYVLRRREVESPSIQVSDHDHPDRVHH
jgi:hypothetical protein